MDDLFDRSGTITSGGDAQDAVGNNDSRRYLIFQNVSDTDMWVRFGHDAEADSPSLLVAAAATMIFQGGYVPTGRLSVLCASTGKAFTCAEGQGGVQTAEPTGALPSEAVTNGLGYTPIDPAALDTDSTLAADSDAKIATQKAVKAHVAAAVAIATATSTQIADKTHAINTASKTKGKFVYNTTTDLIYFALGATDVSKWRLTGSIDATGDVTPS